MRQNHRLRSATLAIVVSVLALIGAVAFTAGSIYLLLSPVTGTDVLPRSLDDFRLFASLSLAIAGFAVVMASAEELRARRRELSEAPESVPSASRRPATSGSKARPATSR